MSFPTMLTMQVILRSAAVGIVIALPLGPAGILSLKRTLAEGRRAGLVSAFGSVLAAMLYVIVVQFSLASLFSIGSIQTYRLDRFAGILILLAGIWIASRERSTRPAEKRPIFRASGERSLFYSSFLITIINPIQLVTFGALMTGAGLTGIHSGARLAAFSTASIFAGSTLWWILATGAMSRIKGRLSEAGLKLVTIGAGILIAFCGLVTCLGSISP